MASKRTTNRQTASSTLLIRVTFLALLNGLSLVAAGQSDSAGHLRVSAYLETYYTYDFGEPASHARPNFIYSYNRHNEVNLNLGFIRAAYSQSRVRANMALMAGTYVNANLAAEPGVLKNIFEANVGVKLSSENNLWLDAGVMPSHIGFESAVGQSCWNLTRSILADNSPYYESGVRVGYSNRKETWYLAALFLNGWQHIQRPPNIQTPALGTQILYQPNEKVLLNWSTFAGNEFPDNARKWRYFNNVYGIFTIGSRVGLTAGFDVGLQQKAKHSQDYHAWYSPVLIVKVSATGKLTIAGRAEYYNDQRQVIVRTGTPNGFQTTGFSINADYNVTRNCLWRIEARGLESLDPIFMRSGWNSHRNFFVTTALSVSI